MENKIEQIKKILYGEKLSDARTILQKIEIDINAVENKEKRKIIFRI